MHFPVRRGTGAYAASYGKTMRFPPGRERKAGTALHVSAQCNERIDETMNNRPEKQTEQEYYLALQERLADAGETRRTDLLTVLLFLLLVFGFMIAGWLLPDRSYSEDENRVLQQLPSFSSQPNLSLAERRDAGTLADKLLNGEFAGEFSTYLSDQFPLRDSLVTVKAAVELALGKKQNASVTYGSEDWLLTRADYPSQDNLKTYFEWIDAFAAYAERKNIPTVLAVAGRPVDVMTDKLPALYPTDTIDKIWTFADETGGKLAHVTYVNLKNPLAEAKKTTSEQLYYRTDHHWTTFGAYVAYTALAEPLGFEAKGLDFFTQERVSANFRGTVWSTSGMKWVPGEEMYYFRYAGDMDYTTAVADGASFAGFYDRSYLETKDQYGSFLSGNKGYVSVRRNDGGEDRQKLLVIKDSFAHSLVPFLAIHYDLDILDLRYYKSIPAALLKSEEYAGILFLANLEYMTDSPESTKLALMTVGIGD